MPTIYIASDHRGFDQKQAIVALLLSRGLDAIDLGPKTYNPEDDYPIYAERVAEAIKNAGDNEIACGILICGSAHGISIATNRFKGVRAIAAYSEELARIGREHNDANVLCLSADFSSLEQNERILWSFLTADFTGEERHKRRIKMLDQLGDADKPEKQQPDLDSLVIPEVF